MKKSLVALAVLAASGAAMAQSSVTLYGIADIWLGSVKVDPGANATTTTKINSGGVQSTRWGMKGTEDLGGGLKANFQFEQGFSLDDGAGSGFSRQSWVGFSGDFGTVRLGHTTTPFDDVSGTSDAVFDSDLSPMNAADGYKNTAVQSGNTPAVFSSTGYNARPTNMIYYKSPEMSGFSGAISYGLDEDKANNGGVANTSLNLTYAGGPLAVQFGYQVENKDNTSSDTSFLRLGASYNFGMATAKIVYGAVDNVLNKDGAKTSEVLVGADVPLAANMILSGAYAVSDDNATAGDTKRSGFGAAVAYLMSKRTTLYGGFKTMKYDYSTGPDLKVSIFAAGVRHTF